MEDIIKEIVDAFIKKFQDSKDVFSNPEFLFELAKAVAEGVMSPDGRMSEDSRSALQARLLSLQERFQ